VSLPTFLIGILLILVFAVGLGWFPSFGRGETVQTRLVEHRPAQGQGLAPHRDPAGHHAGIFQLTLIMRLVRAEMLEVLRTDYIKFARARGLSDRAIHFGHALKNTLVPVMTITGLQLGGLIAFAIITETVFQWPGMGLLFIQAVTFADIPVMAAYLCLIALIFVVINLMVDLLYFAVDPRLRVGKAGGIDAGPLRQPRTPESQRPGVCHIAQFHPELTALRRDLHAHPELGFEEVYTSGRVKEALKAVRRGRNSHRHRQDRRGRRHQGAPDRPAAA
jgi:hypothetical protein